MSSAIWSHRLLSGIEGLGDLVELGAKPVARAIDRMFGTNLVNCPSCEERRKEWNAAVPFSKAP